MNFESIGLVWGQQARQFFAGFSFRWVAYVTAVLVSCLCAGLYVWMFRYDVIGGTDTRILDRWSHKVVLCGGSLSEPRCHQLFPPAKSYGLNGVILPD